MKSRKKLPNKNRPVGLYLYCSKHKRRYSSHTKVKCRCDIQLKYEAKIYIPHSGDKYEMPTLKAECFEDAIIEITELRKKLHENQFGLIGLKQSTEKTPLYFSDCVEDYIDYIEGNKPDQHGRPPVSKKVIRDSKRYLKYAIEALLKKGIKPHVLEFEKLNAKVVTIVENFLIHDKKLGNKTVNNAMGYIKTCLNYITNIYYPTFINPFNKYQALPTQRDNLVIQKSEFMEVINMVSPENSLQIKKNSGNVNHYRPWLIDAFFIALFCGGRTEEPVHMKWRDIQYDLDGQMYRINVVDLKRTRAMDNRGNDTITVFKPIEMTPELEQVLIEMGHDNKKGSDEYILANDESSQRETIAKKISDAFNFYLSRLNLTEIKKFKNLRKTYATECYLNDPEDFYKKMGHTTKYTTLKHYIDMHEVMKLRAWILYGKLDALNERKMSLKDITESFKKKKNDINNTQE